jgi:sugar transferase (PEP-CTERM/EpsH1 system associated)
MNILYITYGLPDPPHGGALARDFHLLCRLAQHHHVVLFCLLEQPGTDTALPGLKRLGVQTHVFSLAQNGWGRKLGAMARHWIARRPLATFPFYSSSLAECLREKTQTESFDIVQIEHSFLAPYIDSLPVDFKGRTLLTFHNIGVEQYRQIAKLNLGWWHRFSFWLKWQMMIGWEARYAEKFGRVIAVSERDADWLRHTNPRLNVSVVENGVDTQELVPIPETAIGHSILFVGTMGYPPNVDAMRWFCDEILPRITLHIPDAHLTIVGRAPNLMIQKLGTRPNVTVTGRVEDVQPYYQRAQVVIVPLRAGGGTRLKILEAMACGRAVVSTTMGCEGLDVRTEDNILVADTPNELADCAVRLLQDRTQREMLAHNARRLVEERYDWNLIGDKLMRMYVE